MNSEERIEELQSEMSDMIDLMGEIQRKYELQRRQIEPLKELFKDALEAIELFINYIVAYGTEDEFKDDPDKVGFAIMHHLKERFRAIDPDWPGMLPTESPAGRETTAETIQRLSGRKEQSSTHDGEEK